MRTHDASTDLVAVVVAGVDPVNHGLAAPGAGGGGHQGYQQQQQEGGHGADWVTRDSVRE